MTEIKRYDVVLVDGVPVHRPSESDQWAKHEGFAALQEQISSYSMSAGHADQRKAESVAVRVALGFSADADDVAPCDLVDAIAALQEQVQALAAENAAMRTFHMHSPYAEEYLDPLPATDGALREIRAQALESLADDSEHEWLESYLLELRNRAAAIRAGEQP